MPESNERPALTEAVYYILLALIQPMHGYGIMQYVKEISHNRVSLGPGTLYGALNTLVEKEWINTLALQTDSRKKEYQITSIGLQVLKKELERIEELVYIGKEIIGGHQNENNNS